jgi:predicted PhzF superfamily epimerase YddE/YHI9
VRLPVYQVNAFAAEPFDGNPAAVFPLAECLSDGLMQRIAAESGMTCAFFVGAEGSYALRWFTPKTEIEGICGHGTLASGFVAMTELGDASEHVTFRTQAGELRVARAGGGFVLDLPALVAEPWPLPKEQEAAFGRAPDEVLGALDLIAVFPAEDDVAGFVPDLKMLARLPLRAAIVTAPGTDADFVSRWFAPKHGDGEDTGFTGSAHCSLVPYWAKRLDKTRLKARQLSPRGATIDSVLADGRVLLSCSAVKYMQGEIFL